MVTMMVVVIMTMETMRHMSCEKHQTHIDKLNKIPLLKQVCLKMNSLLLTRDLRPNIYYYV